MNPKAWGNFMHILMKVIFKYMLQVKYTNNNNNNNACVFNNIKAYYGCYETTSWQVDWTSTHYCGSTTH
jgi:hypothetical protein